MPLVVMEDQQKRSNWAPVVVSVIAGLAFVMGMGAIANGVVRARSDTEMIRVTGSARKNIASDLILWSGTVSYQGNDVASTYSQLKDASDKAVKYLEDKGIGEKEITVSAVRTETLYASTGQGYQGENTFRQIQGYRLSQTIHVRSSDVEKVGSVARNITELIASGVALESAEPQYLYTKIAEVKVEILADAAKDARRRAEEIAKSSGANLQDVRFARMAPLQITPEFDYDISSEGRNDTSTPNKAITAIVTMGFGVK
ncbi:MAG: SIMPL domain-containing protein [Armatimonadetes bacterium]|nr:SIMPL domain-containing protein [Armatimonadota bacterium]